MITDSWSRSVAAGMQMSISRQDRRRRAGMTGMARRHAGPGSDVSPGHRHGWREVRRPASDAHRPRVRVSAGAAIRGGSAAGPRAGAAGVRGAAGPGDAAGGGAAVGAVTSPAPGRARGRPGGRTVPGRVSGHYRERESRPLRAVTSAGRCPAARAERLVERRAGSSRHSGCYQWSNPWDQYS